MIFKWGDWFLVFDEGSLKELWLSFLSNEGKWKPNYLNKLYNTHESMSQPVIVPGNKWNSYHYVIPHPNHSHRHSHLQPHPTHLHPILTITPNESNWKNGKYFFVISQTVMQNIFSCLILSWLFPFCLRRRHLSPWGLINVNKIDSL